MIKSQKNKNNYVLGVSYHIYCPNNTVVLQVLQGKNPRHFEWIKL